MAHTPGPWQWSGDTLEQAENYADVIAPSVSCGVWCEGGSARLTISEADRALIAAAPDLLEALEGLMELERRARLMPIGREWDAARAAIARATGEQQ